MYIHGSIVVRDVKRPETKGRMGSMHGIDPRGDENDQRKRGRRKLRDVEQRLELLDKSPVGRLGLASEVLLEDVDRVSGDVPTRTKGDQ
jgi:hypothetical protein